MSEGRPAAQPDSNQVIKPIPSSQAVSPQLLHQQSAIQLETGDPGSSESGFGGLVVREAIYHPQDRGPQRGAATTLPPAYGVNGSGLAAAEMEQAEYSGQADVPITANAPHSMASDAWKGLVFTLMAGNRNSEALETLNKIPPDVRRQLDADIEFVQGVASLYVAVGDTARAGEYLNRVENYYLLHRSAAPAGLEVQHAWLLYNLKDDMGLYPVMLRLDARQDLSAAERTQLDTLWATWAVRRAETAMEEGNLLRGVEMLQAASKDYPDNLDIRRAVAGAYARVGRFADAVTLFKAIPMDNAAAGDYASCLRAQPARVWIAWWVPRACPIRLLRRETRSGCSIRAASHRRTRCRHCPRTRLQLQAMCRWV